jgi:copper chaperone CopZ
MTTTVIENPRPRAQAIFSLSNLGSSSFSAIIESKLKELAGIKNVTVNNLTDTVLVNYGPRQLTVEQIRAFMTRLRYDAGVGQ